MQFGTWVNGPRNFLVKELQTSEFFDSMNQVRSIELFVIKLISFVDLDKDFNMKQLLKICSTILTIKVLVSFKLLRNS